MNENVVILGSTVIAAGLVVVAAAVRPERSTPTFADRRLRRALDDRRTWDDLEAVVGGLRDECGPDCRPFAVLLGPDSVTVRLAGGGWTVPPAPWRLADGGWTAPRSEVCGAQGQGEAADAYLALGSSAGRLVFLDLHSVPGVLAVTGERRVARELAAALVAQVGSMPRRRVLVAADALPDASAGSVSELLDGLDGLDDLDDAERDPDAGQRPMLVVCADPTPGEAQRISSAVADDPGLRVLVLGDVQGHRWLVEIGTDGWLTLPGLGLGPVRPILAPVATHDFTMS
jgi:hypothetical protein